jgi:hypothetical protein
MIAFMVSEMGVISAKVILYNYNKYYSIDPKEDSALKGRIILCRLGNGSVLSTTRIRFYYGPL